MAIPKVIADKLNIKKSELDYIDEMLGTVDVEAVCSKCNDRGYHLVEREDDIEQCVLCDCTKKRQWNEAFADAGVPKQFFDKTIASDWNINQDAFGNDLGNMKKVKKYIGEFVEKYIYAIPAMSGGIKITVRQKGKNTRQIESLLLLGGIKSGKSLLASIAVQQSLLQGRSAKMYDWIYLCDVLSRYENREEQDKIAWEFGNYDFIVIDGVQNYNINSPCFVLQLDRISRERSRSDKPIIITAGEDFTTMRTGSNWTSLVSSCYKLQLPTPKIEQQMKADNNIVPKRVKIGNIE